MTIFEEIIAPNTFSGVCVWGGGGTSAKESTMEISISAIDTQTPAIFTLKVN